MESNVCMLCGTDMADSAYDESPYCESCQLFNEWLELDKTVDHDGDAPVTETERKQWEIERKLDRFGLRVVFDLVTLQTELVAIE